MKSHQTKILVVVTNHRNRDAVETVLNPFGTKVLFAKSGREAYDLLHSMRIDLVVADLTLPKMDGPVLLEKIRQEELLIPLIFLFGEDDADKVKRVVHHGLLDLIRRPYQNNQLASYAEKALEMSHRILHLNDTLHHLCREARLSPVRTREILSLQKRSISALVAPEAPRKKAA